ncbi:E3 ubiquitin-protein ligase RNFT1-like [Clavelina lepadiformis]|uniref:E3 ubiquitin-protein ligase RNFT1-like n=1 Tax=Clavelina lepadiformis TaxID=159417 RepID=UPI00404313DB
MQDQSTDDKNNSSSVDLEVSEATSVDQTSQQQQAPTMSGRTVILKQAAPLLLLIVLNLFYEHAMSIMLFLSLILVFDHGNDVVVHQTILKKSKLSSVHLCFIIIFSVLSIALLVPLLEKFWLFNLDSMNDWWSVQTTKSIWSVLFHVALMDFIIKFATIAVKCWLILMTKWYIFTTRCKDLFAFIEALSQLLRCISPALEWIKYFAKLPSCIAYVVCWLCITFYCVLKASAIFSKLRSLKHGWKCYKNPHSIGISVNEANHPTLCPICHGTIKNPVQVGCGHNFCQPCCQLWFDRDTRCPVCCSNAVFLMVMEPGKIKSLPPEVAPKSALWKTGTTEYMVQFF